MAAFSLLLRTAGFASGVITLIAIFQAFGGRSWWAAIGWGIAAVLLTAWGRAALVSAQRAEEDYLMGGLAEIIHSSPQLTAEIDAARQTRGMHASYPVGQKLPSAGSAGLQLATMLLIWTLTLGGPIALVVGWFFAVAGNWWVSVAGIAAMLMGSWIASANRENFARNDLADLATAAVPGSAPIPSPAIRRSLWTVAQGVVDPSTPMEHRAPQTAGLYQDFVRAWARDHVQSSR